jgi:hypothetical protein
MRTSSPGRVDNFRDVTSLIPKKDPLMAPSDHFRIVGSRCHEADLFGIFAAETLRGRRGGAVREEESGEEDRYEGCGDNGIGIGNIWNVQAMRRDVWRGIED